MKKTVMAIMLTVGLSVSGAEMLASWSTTEVTGGFASNSVLKASVAAPCILAERSVIKLDETKSNPGYLPCGFFTYKNMAESEQNTEKYIQIFLTPENGKKMTLTQLSFNIYSQVDGPLNAAVRSSLDGFSGNIGNYALKQGANTRCKVDLARLGMNNLGAPVEFRIYLWRAKGLRLGYLGNARDGAAVRVDGF